MDPKRKKLEERWIGKGASGDVYELMGQIPPAVIKYVKYGTEAEYKNLKNECEILKKMEHKNIVTLIETREIDGLGRIGIVMEYCQRGTLHDLIFDPTIIYTMRTVICWSEQLFDALDYMFRMNQVVHRDLKPKNIFVTKDIDKEKDFLLKIGDFGLGKLSEVTSTGSFVGTQRYMSPPQYDESQDKLEQLKAGSHVSHRNDVYSLGLVMWEMIERRRVLASYENAQHGFNRDTFLLDIVLQKFIKVEPPDCHPEQIQEIVTRCTDFSRSSRPMAQEVLPLLKEVLQKNAFFTALDLLPRQKEGQKELFRPIGFDGTQELIAATETSVRPMTSERNFENLPDEVLSKDFRWEDDLIREVILKKFTNSPPKEKKKFIEEVPEIIQEMKEKTHTIPEWKEIFEEKLPKQIISWARDFDVNQQESLPDLFRILILEDLSLQIDDLDWIFSYQKKLINAWIIPWAAYFSTCFSIYRLEKLQRSHIITTNFRLKCYTSSISGEEWLLFDGLKFGLFIFKKDLSVAKRVRPVSTTMTDTGPLELDYFEKTLDGRKDYDEFLFSHVEPLDFDKVIESLKKKTERIGRTIKLTIHKYVPIEDSKKNNLTEEQLKAMEGSGDGDSSISGYVFQLRNPPRSICGHEPKCRLRKYKLPEVSYNSLPELTWPEGTEIEYYECSPGINVDYLDFYYHFLVRLGESYLPGSLVEDINSTFNSTFGSGCFLFLNFTLSIQDEDLNLMLLDHPNNYRPEEMIPGLTFDFEFRAVKVDKVQKYFEETSENQRTYTRLNPILSIDHSPRAQIVDFNQKPLTEIFASHDISKWQKFFKSSKRPEHETQPPISTSH